MVMRKSVNESATARVKVSLTATIMEFYGLAPIMHFRNGNKRVNISLGYVPIVRMESVLALIGYRE